MLFWYSAVADIATFLEQLGMPRLNVFLVEDSDVIRENLVETLEELAPVRVVGTADDEPAAMEWLGNDANQCDLVIVDIFLRRGSGLGILRTGVSSFQHLVFVVFSNYASTDLKRKCLSLGAKAVFDKSTEVDELIAYCTYAAGEAPRAKH